MQRNTDHFFKDRAWLAKELPEIAAACTAAEKSGAEEHPLLVDVGCGVGNALIPILTGEMRLVSGKALRYMLTPLTVYVQRPYSFLWPAHLVDLT